MAYPGLQYQHAQHFGENWSQQLPGASYTTASAEASYTTASVEADMMRLDLPVSNLYAPGDEQGSYAAPGQDYEMTNPPSVRSTHRESPATHNYPSAMIDPRRPRNYHG